MNIKNPRGFAKLTDSLKNLTEDQARAVYEALTRYVEDQEHYASTFHPASAHRIAEDAKLKNAEDVLATLHIYFRTVDA